MAHPYTGAKDIIKFHESSCSHLLAALTSECSDEGKWSLGGNALDDARRGYIAELHMNLLMQCSSRASCGPSLACGEISLKSFPLGASLASDFCILILI